MIKLILVFYPRQPQSFDENLSLDLWQWSFFIVQVQPNESLFVDDMLKSKVVDPRKREAFSNVSQPYLADRFEDRKCVELIV